eukprot:471389-Pelagomonas_calceolata.AAC.4
MRACLMICDAHSITKSIASILRVQVQLQRLAKTFLAAHMQLRGCTHSTHTTDEARGAHSLHAPSSLLGHLNPASRQPLTELRWANVHGVCRALVPPLTFRERRCMRCLSR